jgi:predicted nucleic acid-binding protein
MIVVADTSPLNYLILIKAVHVLEPLYGRVVVPRAVEQELMDSAAPAAVRNWMNQRPDWLEVRPNPARDATLGFLDLGESAALTLAELIQADRLLIDDLAGRAEAERRGMPVTGTLGVLADAHMAGLLNFDQALNFLRATSFRLHPDVEGAIRRRIFPRE